jgi:glycosyltransferase involved in cell wall biosynthesis
VRGSGIKVIHLIPSLSYGGAESMLVKLISSSDRSLLSHVVVSMTSRGPLTKDIENAGVPVIALGMPSGIPHPAGLWRLHALLSHESPDVLSTWLYHADLLGSLAATMARVPAVVWNVQCADLDLREHPWHLRWTVRILGPMSHWPSAVVVNSRAGQLASERLGYRPRRWELIPSGFDLERFAPREGARSEVRATLQIPSSSRLVGIVARYHPMKDHLMFLSAAARVHAVQPDVHFVLAGRGVDDRNATLTRRVAECGLSSCVHLVGVWPDVAQLLAGLDIACCSSYSEAFPNAIGEAMACGIPCVSTEVGDCATLVGDTGALVPARNPEAFASALIRLLEMPASARQALGAAARARMAAKYAIAAVARRYDDLFTELAAASGVGSRNPHAAT